MANNVREHSEAAQIYVELGSEGAEKYASLIELCTSLNTRLLAGEDVNAELMKINQELYELKQEARLVSSR